MEQQQEEMVNKVYQYAFQLKAKGNNAEEIKENLINQGLDATSAETVTENVEKHYSAAKNKAADKNMLYGGLWCVGGIVVTAATYSAASGGGSYVVAWGAILFGGIQFFRGLSQRV